MSVRSASRTPFALASVRNRTSPAPAPRDEPIRCAAWREPPADLDTYCETARPRLRRSLPPELAKRVKLFLADVKRSDAPAGAVGRGAGAGGTAGDDSSGGVDCVPSPSPAPAPPSPSPCNQLGMSGVPPPAPPYAFEVPISDHPSACEERRSPSASRRPNRRWTTFGVASRSARRRRNP